MEWDVSGNLVPVLYFSQEHIQGLALSPLPVPSCGQTRVLSTERIPATCAAGTAGTAGDAAPKLQISVVVGICTQVYLQLARMPPAKRLLFLFSAKSAFFLFCFLMG